MLKIKSKIIEKLLKNQIFNLWNGRGVNFLGELNVCDFNLKCLECIFYFVMSS